MNFETAIVVMFAVASVVICIGLMVLAAIGMAKEIDTPENKAANAKARLEYEERVSKWSSLK